jgi:hypothetical protein
MRFAQDNHMVDALASDLSDQPFGEAEPGPIGMSRMRSGPKKEGLRPGAWRARWLRGDASPTWTAMRIMCPITTGCRF